MDLPRSSKRMRNAGPAAKAFMTALAFCLSGVASGASKAEADCDEIARDLKSLDTPVDSLNTSPVDHVSIDTDPVDLDNADLKTGTVNSTTPFLFLAPRVATVLRDIFDAGDVQGSPDENVKGPFSPIAESEDGAEFGKILTPEPQDGQDVVLPHYQRQMYRIDI